MINSISSCGTRAANIASLRQNRSAKGANAEVTTSAAASPAHHRSHIPPGLARAAERIASNSFKRSDTNVSGTVTKEELSAIHSRHAKAIISSDLFGAGTSAPEGTADTPTQGGLTEAQLKDALTKFFYAKVGVTYPPATTPAPQQTDPTPDESTSSGGVQAMA